MRSFLLSSMPILLWVFTALHVFFIFYAFKKFKESKNMLYLLTLLVSIGLFYDGLILSLGSISQNVGLLGSLSQMRFISHGALIPLLFPICAYSLNANEKVIKVVWIITALICVLGIAEGCATDLELRQVENVLRFASSDNTPSWAKAVSSLLSFGTIVPLMITGVICWIKKNGASLFLSGFFMFAFSALGPATGNFDLIFFVSMAGEVLMILFLLLFANRVTNK